ncbi:hypothetical protein BDW22DRAFT_1340917, partial [Trametopsis cervina]
MYSILPAGSEEGERLRNRFRILTKSDLKISTEFLASDIRGNRHTPQSWIWSSDVDGDIENSGLMHEYHRVVWLRAKARRDRWREEKAYISFELDCIARFHKNKSQ